MGGQGSQRHKGPDPMCRDIEEATPASTIGEGKTSKVEPLHTGRTGLCPTRRPKSYVQRY